MSSRNSVAIITSPRPRVGKTLLARLLTDFHLEEGRPVAAFDLNAGEGTLAHSGPSTSRSSIDDLKGQMALFDCLMTEDDATKIADLGQVSFERFFTLAFQFGLAEEARRRGIVPMLLYLMSPDRRSVEAYRDLCRRLPEAMLAPVHNEIFGVAQYGNKYAPIGSGTVIVRLPITCGERAQIRGEATFLVCRFQSRRVRC
jgi:hypothetical protein